MGIYEFLTVLLLTLGLGLLIAGLFTAYFGRGKSRNIGILLAVLGIVVGALIVMVYYMDWMPFAESTYLIPDVLMPAIKYVGSFLIGGAIALVIFLAAIMKT